MIKVKELIKYRKLITKDIFFSFLNYGWKIFSNPITLLLIPLYLSSISQGYWYTFLSVAALSVFADMGFTTIVAQFSAHEFAFLSYSKDGYFFGDDRYLNRLSSLFRFVFKWSIYVSLIAFPLILFIGIYFFKNSDIENFWVIPWILYATISGFSFTLGVLFSFLEGCNQISKVQIIRLVSSILSSVSMWLFLFLGYGLFSLSLSLLITVIINTVMIILYFGKGIKQLIILKTQPEVPWKHDFIKLLWKYAISWMSGYFIFQLYTPLAFRFINPVFAGKVGISISLVTAISSISNVWIYVNTPRMNMLSSKKDWLAMDNLLRQTLTLSLLTYLFGSMSLVTLSVIFRDKITIRDRFVDTIPIIMLLASWFFQIIITNLATYLRAHKQEPLLFPSLISSLFIATVTFLAAKYLSDAYYFLGFLGSYIFLIPWTLFIFVKKKKEWHQKTV